jgi:uncharacterized oxidoreductase
MLVERAAMKRFTIDIFRFFGATDANAQIVATHLVDSSEMGLNSHGVIRIPQYVSDVRERRLDPAATPELVSENGALASLNGNHCFGQVAGVVMADKAVEIAEREGAALVTAFRFGHTGRLGAYAQRIADRGFFGLVASGGSRSLSGNWVAPFGGKEGRLSTNPIAYGFPVAGGAPVVADFATSTTAEGVVRSLRNRGLQAPPGTLREADGTPTNDPGVLYTTPHGFIEPLGGPHYGHKGTAIGILPAALALLAAGQPGWEPSDGTMAVLAVKAGRRFAEETGWMAEFIRDCPPLDPARPVLMPGDKELAAILSSRGILVDEPTWEAISELAEAARVELPRAAASV